MLSQQPPQNETTAQFPAALDFLFWPKRYKVAFGGRGSAKSWGFARALLILGAQMPLRVLCARELQKSIEDSVHKLLADQIKALGLEDFYLVQERRIIGANGTEFIFGGLRHNVTSIKSLEACDIVWVEEAQSVSKKSWDTLIPTIRKPGSEIWVSFNPDLASDETYVRFVVNTPPDAIVRRVNYTDNPWFPDVLRRAMEHLKATDRESYLHVYEGNCISVVAGAIYAEELRAADRDRRITRIPYDPTVPVHTFWDIGYGDQTAIWFVQLGAFEYRLIDYLENNRKPLAWYLKELQNRPYVYGTHWLPWDARPKQFGSGKSVEELMMAAGFNVQIVTQLTRNEGINAARSIFPLCYFDSEKCADGLQALRHYRFAEPTAQGATHREPLHDQYSHGSDAFRYFAVGIRQPERERPKSIDDEEDYAPSANGWMG